MTTGEAPVVVQRFLAAYNAKDLTTVAGLLHEDVHVVHYGTDFDVRGRDAVVERFAQNASGAFAERRFCPPRRRLLAGEHVIVEHVWEATASTDVPGRAAAGERVTMELCTIFLVQDGVIVEYAEYG